MIGQDQNRFAANAIDATGCLSICADLLGVERQGGGRLSLRSPNVAIRDLNQMLSAATDVGFVARIVQWRPGELDRIGSPAVLQRRDGGFLVFDGTVRGGRPRVRADAVDWRFLAADEIEDLCAVALEVTAYAPIFPRRERARLSALGLLQWTPAIRSGLLQSIILSVALQLYLLIAPLFLRTVVDVVVVENDAQLLNALVFAFSILATFNAVAMVLRGVAVRNLSADLNWNITRRIFHHLIRLPLDWFQTQRLGDVLSKVQGADQVRSYLSGATGGALDGVFSILTLVMLAIFSPVLACISGLGLAVYIGVRVVTAPYLMRLARDSIVVAGAEQGKRIETLRAIQTVKVMGAERGRERDWAATLADSIVKSQTQALAATNFASFQSFISTLTTVAFIYVGARLALSGQMTIGVLTAALAYHGQFSQRASSLFEQLLAFKMLDVQLERVADIVLQPPERGLEVSSGATRPLLGRLDISDVGFAYSADGPQVLHRVNLSVESGEHVAIAGPSGCGKSTLAKLVCGLYRPLSGEILIDGQTIDQIGLSHLRASLGVVMQDDQLISGSVLENVAFFSEAIDVTRVWECLALARIDDEIRALPLAAETEVGDMGVVFSGGQKQRLLIARALYRQPSILLLDEATSNLDVASEQAIIGTLNELKITRIVISHRPETIAAADRVIRLSRGD